MSNDNSNMTSRIMISVVTTMPWDNVPRRFSCPPWRGDLKHLDLRLSHMSRFESIRSIAIEKRISL